MKPYPLLPAAALYLAGILLACWISLPLAWLFGIAFALSAPMFAWQRGRPFLLALLIVLSGWINLTQRTVILSPRDLRLLAPPDTARIALVRGVLRDTPQRRSREENGKRIESTTAEIEVAALQSGANAWQPAVGRVVVTTHGLLPGNFFAGQTVEVNGVLGAPPGPMAEGLFDYSAYLRNLGIHHQLRVESPADWQILSSPARPPLADRFREWGRQTLARGRPERDQTLELEWALTLGWKAVLTEEVSEPFVQAATYHIFAVDGLRIGIIAGILAGLLRVLGVTRPWRALIVIPFIWFYAALTGWPASAVRAIVMATIIFGGWMLHRPSNPLNSLFAAALILLVWEPRELFQAGFQLSFLVVLCIILIMPFFKRLELRLLRGDPLLPDPLLPRWQRVLRGPARWLLGLSSISLASWFGSIPLVVYYFHLVTPASGPANVIAVPLCGFVLVCNLASLLFGSWFPWLSEIFNHAGWFLMRGIEVTSQWFAHCPGAYFYLSMPGWLTLALYYYLLVGLLTGWLGNARWRRWKLSVLAVLAILWVAQWAHQWPVTQLTVLPLNGGHAIHLHSPGPGNDWLIDCGDDASLDHLVKPFLHAHGVNRLSHFILTHGEKSYTGGAERVLELFRPKNIHTGPGQSRSPTYKAFQETNQWKPEWKSPLHCGDALGPWTVLHPQSSDQFGRGNDNALVLLGEINHFRVLLLSDLGKAGQRALLERAGTNTNALRADIVVAGMPADAEPLGDPLLDAIQPRVVIVADSNQNAARAAGRKLKQRLALRNVPIIYTSAAKAVTLQLRPGQWSLGAMDGTRRSGAIP